MAVADDLRTHNEFVFRVDKVHLEEIGMTQYLAGEGQLVRSVGRGLRGAFVGLTLPSLLGLIPNSAWALAYVISPDVTFDSTAAPSVPLTGI